MTTGFKEMLPPFSNGPNDAGVIVHLIIIVKNHMNHYGKWMTDAVRFRVSWKFIQSA